MVIYLMRMLRGEKLDSIGKFVNMNTYSSVSSVIERMKAQIDRGRKLRRRVEEIKGQILMSQEQTPFLLLLCRVRILFYTYAVKVLV